MPYLNIFEDLCKILRKNNSCLLLKESHSDCSAKAKELFKLKKDPYQYLIE